MATTDNLLFKIKTKDNPELQDDQLVKECMDALMKEYPQVQSYQFDRIDKETILILVWFSEPVEVVD